MYENDKIFQFENYKISIPQNYNYKPIAPRLLNPFVAPYFPYRLFSKVDKILGCVRVLHDRGRFDRKVKLPKLCRLPSLLREGFDMSTTYLQVLREGSRSQPLGTQKSYSNSNF